MSRPVDARFDDILAAIARCLDYRVDLEGSDLRLASMAMDAVLRNLAVIGEAVRALPEEEKAELSEVPWASIAGLRNIVIHEYVRIDAETIIDILDHDLAPLATTLRERRGE